MKSGKRVNQLGATFVVGPGLQIRYAQIDVHTADHAPISKGARRAVRITHDDPGGDPTDSVHSR